jgi:hypothetical protein
VPGVETKGRDSIIACLWFSIPVSPSLAFWVTSATFPPAERGLAPGLGVRTMPLPNRIKQI